MPQANPEGQVPHLPPQPSSPHFLAPHWGLQKGPQTVWLWLQNSPARQNPHTEPQPSLPQTLGVPSLATQKGLHPSVSGQRGAPSLATATASLPGAAVSPPVTSATGVASPMTSPELSVASASPSLPPSQADAAMQTVNMALHANQPRVRLRAAGAAKGRACLAKGSGMTSSSVAVGGTAGKTSPSADCQNGKDGRSDRTGSETRRPGLLKGSPIESSDLGEFRRSRDGTTLAS